MELRLEFGDARELLQLRSTNESILVERGEEQIEARVLAWDRSSLLLEIEGRRFRVRHSREGSELHLHIHGHLARIHRIDEEQDEALEIAELHPEIRAPMPGKILEILVAEGEHVRRGQPVLRVEAMKMEVDLESSIDGTVQRIHVRKEQIVEPEQCLVTLEPDTSPAAAPE